VSWSLCIEEHFYFFLPLFLLVTNRFRLAAPLVFVALILVSPVCRCLSPVGEVNKEFGFWSTATQLRLEWLLLGFWTSYLVTVQPLSWVYCQESFSMAVRLLWNHVDVVLLST
jgi:peptidoglycan/LPS O-acetylase OafA/YrhL